MSGSTTPATPLNTAGVSLRWDSDKWVANTASADAVIATAANGANLTAFRNVLLNGAFTINQFLGPATTNGAFVCDRWRVFSLGAGGSRTGSRAVLTSQDRADIGGSESLFCLQYAATGSSAAGAYEFLSQRVESAFTFAGQNVTVSFWARRTAGSGNIACNLAQIFNSSGNDGHRRDQLGHRCTLTTSWQKFTFTRTLGLVNTSLLVADQDSLEIGFWFSEGATGTDPSRSTGIGTQTITVQIADVQVEAGTTATPFERRDPGTEWFMCQRYAQTVLLGAQNVTASGDTLGPFYFATPMRYTPTLWQTISEGQITNCVILAEGALSPLGGYIQIRGTGVAISNNVITRVNLYVAE